ncbi:galanin-like peptide [Carlito syrichta]|uniref:Galanin-like peptide n=1 Tax=Carlito syrichta TaxID=1868482 RepID=A0A1U7T9W6_CARSF|nr:galanin-like peptide [Carlito syrichta]
MAPSVHLVLLLTLWLSLAETPASVPVHQGRGGWTLNSAGYLLGPVPPLPRTAGQDGRRAPALELLQLWKAVDGLPYSHPQTSKRSPMEAFANTEIGGKMGRRGKDILGRPQKPGLSSGGLLP